MSIECGECERDLRGSHALSCSRYTLEVCPECARRLHDGDGYLFCPAHGEVNPMTLQRADLPPTLSAAMELPEVRALAGALENMMGYFDTPIARRKLPQGADAIQSVRAALAAIKEPKI